MNHLLFGDAKGNVLFPSGFSDEISVFFVGVESNVFPGSNIDTILTLSHTVLIPGNDEVKILVIQIWKENIPEESLEFINVMNLYD